MKEEVDPRILPAVVFLILLGSVSACDSRTRSTPIPTAPITPTVPNTPIPRPATQSPRASLEVFNVNVTEVEPHSGQRNYFYAIKFSLKETSGMSGATIVSVASGVDGVASETTGPSCWVEQIRVEPGGTLDVFDKGWDTFGYCAPTGLSVLPASSVVIVVTFADDDNRMGSVDARATIAR
jgi:hypothetical protein